MPETTLDRDVPTGASATVREVAQQPEVWAEVQKIVELQRADLRGFLDGLLAKRDLRIVLTGAGTSAFIGSIAAPALARALGRRVEAVATTDIVSDPLGCFAEDVPTLLVSFARSGNSPESTAATRLADQVLTDVSHLVVTCDENGELFRDHVGLDSSRVVLMPSRSNDEGFAMTSSYSSMLLAALLILGPDEGAVDSVVRGAADVLGSRQDDIRALAASGFERVVYLGSGPLAGLARESALKMLELSAGRVVAYHDSPLGFRHGPKSVLNESTLVVVYVSSDPYTRRYDLDIVAELRESVAPGRLLAISAQPFDEPGEQFWQLGTPGLPDQYAALVFSLVAQLLALWTSIGLGIATDNPFPGGAVNRVVQGVTVYPLDRE